VSAARTEGPEQLWDGKAAGANRSFTAPAALPPDEYLKFVTAPHKGVSPESAAQAFQPASSRSFPASSFKAFVLNRANGKSCLDWDLFPATTRHTDDAEGDLCKSRSASLRPGANIVVFPESTQLFRHALPNLLQNPTFAGVSEGAEDKSIQTPRNTKPFRFCKILRGA
jgi:hypothetical protein